MSLCVVSSESLKTNKERGFRLGTTNEQKSNWNSLEGENESLAANRLRIKGE